MRGSVPPPKGEGGSDLRRGPWTREEDNLLIHYIAHHGEGRWNMLAKCAGLKRTGKSCRLRWLNYLKPDIKRGNLSDQEQLLILELHYKWGNRWSKIAQHLPGRTDNEIKNYWRTRVQKQARQLNIESSSKSFLDAARLVWVPRLLQRTNAHSSSSSIASSIASPSTPSIPPPSHNPLNHELPHYYNAHELSSSSTSHAVPSADMGKPCDQPEVPRGLPSASEYVEDTGAYGLSFDSAYFYNMDDFDAMSASLGTPEGTSSLFCHVDESDIVGHAVDDGFWTTGGLW